MTRRTPLAIEDVRAAARNRWLDIFQALAGSVLGEVLEHRPGTHVRCPFHGGDKDFRLDGRRSRFGSAEENGGAICTCGSWKDGFALLSHANGWTFLETLVAVARYLGFDVDERGCLPDRQAESGRARLARQKAEAARAKAQREANRKRADRWAVRQVQEVWDGTRALTDRAAEPVQRYLARRGLSVLALRGNSDVRYHPALPYYARVGDRLARLGEFPALVSLVRAPDGRPVTLHRTYLTFGGAQLTVDKAKKLMAYPSTASLTGAAIRLFPAGPVLGIAEGIETALSVQYALGLPCWAAVSASLLQGFCPPDGTHTVIVWADKDRSGAGLQAAQQLKQRLWKRGIRARIELPDWPLRAGRKSIDWNDVWKMQGRLGFPSTLRQEALSESA